MALGLAAPGNGRAADPRQAFAPQEIAETARSVLDGSRYQVDLPHGRPAPPAIRPPRLQPDVEPQSLSTFAQVLMAIVAVIALVVAFHWLAGLALPRRARGDAGEAAPDGMGTRGPDFAPADALAEADRLAAGGDFDAAVHCLLLGAVERTRKLVHTPIMPSLTSREIVGRTDLTAAAHTALRTLVAGVEISRFGGRAATADVYGRCRESYARIAGVAGSTVR